MHEVIKESAMTVLDLTPGLLKRLYVTGRPFISDSVFRIFTERINELLREEIEAFEIGRIQVERVYDCQRAVFNGMKKSCKGILGSEKWIDLYA